MPKNTSNPLDQFISQVVEKPQVFFASNQKIMDSALEMAKHFYDNVKKTERVPFSPFTELLTEGFDNDQIWEEIASQNEPFLEHAKHSIKAFNKRPVKQVYSEEESDHSMDLDQDQDEEMQEIEQEDSDQDLDFDQNEAEEEEDQDEEEEEDLDQDEQIEEDSEEELVAEDLDETDVPAKKGVTEVDDEFFNLEKFNKWTDQQEELDMMSDRDDQDDGFDFDNDLGDEEDSEDEDNDEDAAEMTYNDFFGSEEKPARAKKPYTPKKKIEYEEELVDSEEEDEEDEEELDEADDRSEGSVRDLFGLDESENDQEEEKSAFQKQQERLAAQIEEYEEENVADKHWTLRGEAKANARPVNSLLEEDLEFEHANKPVPVITQESTNTLEDMIKKRILDNMFDDVERKVDPTLRPFIPSKRVEISDEKSKQSLADMYEDDFVRKQAGSEKVDARDEALEKEHNDITELFNTLCHKLDALSNFHYTPKAAKPEMSIVSNSAAISMEEVTPVNVSDATLLAPEEVYDKKRGDVKTAAEMDQDERKRLRATKKKLKRKERDMKERELKVMQKYNPQVGQRQEKKKAVKELLGQKNVTIIGKDGQKKTTSKAVTSASLF